MNLQDMIGRGDIDEKKEDKVGTIWEGTRTANKIDIQGTSLDIQDKQGTESIKSRAISETVVIKADIQTIIAMVKNIGQDHRKPMDSFKK